MRRHSGSTQKPVPKSCSVAGATLGTRAVQPTEDGRDFFFSFNLNAVIGRTVLLKSCAEATEMSETIVTSRRNEHRIEIERTLCRDIRFPPTLNHSGSDVLHLLIQ